MNYNVKDENPKLQYYILRGIYITLITISVLYFNKSNYDFFYKALRVSSVVFLGIALFIGESTKIGNKKNLVSYLNAGLIWIILIKIMFIIDNNVFIISNKMFFYQLFSIILQYIIFLSIVLERKKKSSFKSLNRKLMLIFLIGNLIYFFIFSSMKFLKKTMVLLCFKNIVFLVIIFLFLITFMNIVISSEKYDDEFFYYSIIYILLNSVGNLVILNKIGNGLNISVCGIFLGMLIEFTSYYVLAEGLISSSLNKSFNDLNKVMSIKKKEYRKNRKYLNKKIKELKELENLLNQEEILFNEIVSSIGDYLFMFNDDKLFYLNNKALNLLGINNREEILLKNIEVVKEMISKRKMYDKAKLGLDGYSEIILKTQDNEFLDGEVYTIPLGENYTVIIIKDVTKRNNVLRLNKYLTKQLQEEHIKGEFFTNICHELRTPINVLNSALQLNDLNIKNENIESIEKNNLIIRKNCLRLIRTINNFIDANRISEGHIDTVIMVYNIVEVVENTIDASSEYIKKKNINIIFDPDFEEAFVAFDKDLLERVLLNILSNSLKYGKYNGKVYIRIYFEEKNLVIMIENDGDIISFDEQKYIFDKFTKNNKALNRTQEGSGLGLYISKSLMNIMGGDLKVNVNEEKGNQFKLYFYDIELFKENESIELEFKSDFYNLMEKVEVEFSDIYI